MNRSKKSRYSDRHLRRKIKEKNENSLERVCSSYLSLQQYTASLIEENKQKTFVEDSNAPLENKCTFSSSSCDISTNNSVDASNINITTNNTRENVINDIITDARTNNETVNISLDNVLYEDWFSYKADVESTKLTLSEDDIFEDCDNRYSDDEETDKFDDFFYRF